MEVVTAAPGPPSSGFWNWAAHARESREPRATEDEPPLACGRQRHRNHPNSVAGGRGSVQAGSRAWRSWGCGRTFLPHQGR